MKHKIFTSLIAILTLFVIIIACSDDKITVKPQEPIEEPDDNTNDTDDSSTVITASDFFSSITENIEEGTVLGMITASTNDNSTISYKIVTQTPSGATSINSAGELLVNNSDAFNYEINPTVSGKIELNAGDATSTIDFTISVLENQSSNQKVLIVAADSEEWILDVKEKLESVNYFSEIGTFPANITTPNLQTLNDYDVVLLWANSSFSNAELLGDNLAKYIEDGGAVVQAVHSLTNDLGVRGRYKSEYAVVTSTEEYPVAIANRLELDFSKSQTNHPILKNVDSYNGGGESYHNSDLNIRTGSEIIAKYTNDEPLIIVNEFDGKTRGVFLNMYPVSDDMFIYCWDAFTDGAFLMANALQWAGNQ